MIPSNAVFRVACSLRRSTVSSLSGSSMVARQHHHRLAAGGGSMGSLQKSHQQQQLQQQTRFFAGGGRRDRATPHISRRNGGRPVTKTKRSTNAYMRRHVKDPYVKKAKAEGVPSRSYYKLEWIQERYKIFKGDELVIDLGAAPGGWTSFIATPKIKPKALISVDIFALDAHVEDRVRATMKEHFAFVRGDFEEIADELPECDIVLSDMLPNMIGDKRSDALQTLDLVESALRFAIDAKANVFVCKLLDGGPEELEIRDLARAHFEQVKSIKPPASRSESREKYMLARNRKDLDVDGSKKQKK